MPALPSDMQCFATSADGKKVFRAKGRSLLFFDASDGEQLNERFFGLSSVIIDSINRLKFSPHGKFVFLWASQQVVFS